jgi:soluble lytic murein transglycosylase-like protein
MISKGAFAEYSEVEMLLGALPRDLRAKAVMKLELVRRDPSMFKYNKLRKHVIGKCATPDALALLDSDGACTVPGVSRYSVPAAVPLLRMAVVVNLAAIPKEETTAPVQATAEIPIAKAEYTIDTKMDNMMKPFDASTFQLCKANEPRYGGY